MEQKKNRRVKWLAGAVCVVLAAGVLWALNRPPKGPPGEPLTKEEITAVLEEMDLPWFVAETQSGREGQVLYTLRHQTETHGNTDNPLYIAGISTFIHEGEEGLFVVFREVAPPEHPRGEPFPFAWEDWKEEMGFVTRLYGGFADGEALYEAVSDKETPEEEPSLSWDVPLSNAYCRVKRTLGESGAGSPVCSVAVNLYESKALCRALDKEAAAGRDAALKAMEARQKTP